MLLRGLCGDLCSLNGRTGVLQEQLEEGPLALAEGECVLICGLRRRAELNGQRVRIDSVTARGRYVAVLDSGEALSLRRANLSSLQWCVELEPGEARGEEHAKLVSLNAAYLVATAVQPHGRVVLRANAAQPVAEGQPLPPAMSQEGRRGWRWCGVAASRLAGGWWRVRLEGGVGDVRVRERHLWAAPPRLPWLTYMMSARTWSDVLRVQAGRRSRLRPLLAECEQTTQQQGFQHSKVAVRRWRDGSGYLYLGSHNFSPAAWGSPRLLATARMHVGGGGGETVLWVWRATVNN